ncbi:autotransporter outer membrane beta-barrel domain-containing protein [Sutterella wadsworthensis]|uniref:autotransporter outer membrane beta-barrel domain-containing protein n=1 Tax=Sutterella wadsworthensis TaxID=40545 RepID=UPI00307D2712
MNRTYKVAKSLTRGVVVTSEKASSYQGKAVKTVIAAAAATLVAGSAMATSYIDPVEGAKVYADTTAEQTDTLNDSIVYKKTENGTGALVTPNQSYTFDKTLWVIADQAEADAAQAPKYVQANGFFMSSSAANDSKLTNKGTIYVTALNKAHYWATHAMSGDKGEIINDGTIIAKNAVALASGSNGNGVKIINNGTIVVENQGRAIGLEAGTAPVAENNGTITVGALAEDAEQIIGVYISDNVTNASFTNKKGGVINAAAEGAIAIGFYKGSNNTATLATGSITQGDIVVSSFTGSTDSPTASTSNINIEKDASVTGDVIVKFGTAALTGAEGAAVDGDLIAANGSATVAEELTFNNVSVGAAAVATGDDSEAATNGNVTVTGELNAATLTLNTADSAFTNEGTVKFNTITFAKASADTPSTTDDTPAKGFVNDGKATVENLVFVNTTDTITNSGTLIVQNVDTGKLESVGVTNTGTIETSLANLIKSSTDEDGSVTYTATAFGSAASTNNTGDLIDTSTTGTYSLDDYKNISSALGDKFNFKNANIVAVDAEGKQSKLDLAEIGSSTAIGPTNFGRSDVIASYNSGDPDFNGAQFLARPLTIGSLEVAKTEANENELKSLTIGNATTNTLTLRGNAKGEVIIGAKEGDKLVDVTFRRVDLGAEDTDFGTIDNAVTFAAASTITGAFTFTNEAGTTVAADNGNLTVNGTMTTNGLTNNGQISVNGDLDTAWYEQGDSANTVVITDGTFAILGNKPAATTTQAEGDEEAPKAFENAVKVQTVSFGTTADETNLGVLSVGASTAAANATVADAYGEIDADKSVIYIAKQAVFGDGTAALSIGGAAGQATDLLVDIQGVAGTAGYAAKDGVLKNAISADNTNGAKVTLVGVKNAPAAAFEGENGAKTLKLADSATGGTLTVDYGTMFYGTSTDHTSQGTVAADGTISFARNTTYDKLLDDTYQGGNAKADLDAVSFGHNQLSDAVVWGLTDYIADVKASDGYSAAQDQRQYLENKISDYLDSVNTASVMALAGGAFNTALDVNDQVTAALERRTSLASLNAPRTIGVTPWVDVFGTTNEGKRLYGEGYGYEADIYGAVLGLDYTASCGATIGLAFNVGQADSNSVGDGIKVDNDSDFYGVSLYAAQQLGDFNLRADVGYTKLKNDLSTNTVFGQVKESEDADVFTFGVGTEYLAKFGALNIVPHAGIRLTRIDMDDSKFGADYDTMTVYQMPLGVAFSGTFDTNGWKVAPMVDLSVVPTFGDKDVKYTFVGASDSNRVFDSNPIRATIGVEAQKDAWTFGLNYGLTAGSDDRLNNAFNANLRYSF